MNARAFIRCWISTFLTIPCLNINATGKCITSGGNDPHKLLEACLIEIYDAGIVSVMYLIQERQLCFVSNWIWRCTQGLQISGVRLALKHHLFWEDLKNMSEQERVGPDVLL